MSEEIKKYLLYSIQCRSCPGCVPAIPTRYGRRVRTPHLCYSQVTHMPLLPLRHNSSSRHQSSWLPAADLAERKPLLHLQSHVYVTTSPFPWSPLSNYSCIHYNTITKANATPDIISFHTVNNRSTLGSLCLLLMYVCTCMFWL